MKKLPCFRSVRAIYLKIMLAVAVGWVGSTGVWASSATVVISQIFGGGGNAGSVYKNDFIELFNKSSSAVNLSGWSVQYASATGTTTFLVTTLSGSIQPYSYFLVQEAASTGGTTSLPTADVTGTINLSATAGKVALVNNTTTLNGQFANGTGTGIIDFVGYGATANGFEGSGPTPPAPANTNSVSRADGGCTDTDSNTNDFTSGAVVPHNSASATHVCGAATGPGITTQPHDVTVSDGGTTNFSVTATGSGPLYYQWQRDGTNFNVISTSSSLAFNPVALADAGTYAVIVSNTVSTATSSPATLTVNAAGPTITGQPVSVVSSAGTNVVFLVTASGTAPLSYQWKKNAVVMGAATNSSLTLSNVTTADAGSYLCVVSNSVNTATSAVATLTIAANTFTIMQYNVDGNSITGTDPTNWAATAPQVLAIGREITYLKPDIIMFNEIPTSYQYQMTNWPFLTNYYQATNAAGDGFIENAVASKYPIVSSVSHLHGSSLAAFGYSGSFTRDLFEAEIAVPGLSATLHVFQAHLKATDSTPQQDDADKRAAEARAVSNYFVNVYLPGASGSHPYTLSGDMNEDAFFPETNHYTSGHPLQSMTAAATGLQMTDPVNTNTLSDDTESIRGSLNTRFDYILPCSSLFSNILTSQVFRTDKLTPLPSSLNANDDSVASDHLPVLMTFAVPSASAPFLGTDVASITNLAGTTATFSVIAGGGTPLSYQWHHGATDLSDGGNVSGSTSATLSLGNVLAADAGSYSVTITNSIGSTNSGVATLTVIDPGISPQPTNQTIFQGGWAVFSVGAAGTGSLSYQWRKGVTALSDGGDISGAMTASLTVTNAVIGDAGTYSVAVTGSAGTTVSSNAVLTVVVGPAITTQPASRTNNATTTATFAVAASGTSPVYQWLKNGSPLANGGNILGATSATLSVTNVLAGDGATYSVIITNAAGTVTSSNAVLTVIDPAFTIQPKDGSTQLGGTVIFTATAVGTAPITYVWQKNSGSLTDGGNITGSATSALTVSSVSTGDIAQYAVVATGGAGSATSTTVLLSMIASSGELFQSGASYNQNFDGMGTGTNLPAGWIMSPAGTAAPTFQAAGNFSFVSQVSSSGSPATGGRYSWGNGANISDRAVGFMTSGGYGSPNSLMTGFYNNAGGTITALAFTFDYERYRTNQTAPVITFFISLDGTNWLAQTSGDSGTWDTSPTGTGTYSFTNGTVISRTVNVTGLSIPAGSTYYMRWNFVTGSVNSQGLGLDNFTMAVTTAGSSAVNPLLSALLTPGGLVISWPTNGADGFGLQSSTNVSSTNWLTVGGAVVSGTNYTVTVQATNFMNLYRLKK